MDEKNLSLMEHLEELRRVLTISLIVVVVASGISYFLMGDYVFKLVTSPLENFDVNLVYIGMAEAFLTRIKLGIVGGIVLSLPVLFWQAWSFVAPALFPHERRLVLLVVPLSLVLFVAGAVFAYLVVFRFAAYFLLVTVSGEELRPMLSIGQYVSFLISFVLPFGLVFQLPLIVYFLSRFGFLGHEFLRRNRKYVVLICFVIAAVLTPPDMISQILLAIPMLLLYEISILVARVTKPREARGALEEKV